MKKIFIETDKYLAQVGESEDLDMYSFLKHIIQDDDKDINTFLDLSHIKKTALGEPGTLAQLSNKEIFDKNSVLFKRRNGKYIVEFGDESEPISAVRYFVESNDNNGRWAQNQNAIDLIGDKNIKKLLALYKAEKGEKFSEEDFNKESKIGKILVALSQNEEMSDNTEQIAQSDENALQVPYQRIQSKDLIAYINSDEYEFPFSSQVLADTQLITAFRDDLMKMDLAQLQAMLNKLKQKNELLRMKIRALDGDEVAKEQVAKMEAANVIAQEMRYNAQSGAYEAYEQGGDTSVNVNNEVHNNKTYHTKGQTGTINNINIPKDINPQAARELGRAFSNNQQDRFGNDGLSGDIITKTPKSPFDKDDGGAALDLLKSEAKTQPKTQEQATQTNKTTYRKHY